MARSIVHRFFLLLFGMLEEVQSPACSAMASRPRRESDRPAAAVFVAEAEGGGLTVTRPVATSMVSWKAVAVMSAGGAASAGPVGGDSEEQPVMASRARVRCSS